MEDNLMNKVELLAPVGKPDVLKSVIEAGADAVYLGGKNFNMRQHRSDFNFDEFQLKKAEEFVHMKGKRIYVTVNSLLKDDEIASVVNYLSYLDEIGIDAIIIQDIGLLKHLSDHSYNFEVHASTMMNVHNIETARLLKSMGVSRIVTSRDISLDQVLEISKAAAVECEYFIHGDMCASQSGQCYHSGILFGQSSNRGRCLKSCRWPYEFYDITRQKKVTKKQYYLARKDMCMIQHVNVLIEKGVASLKIEGRMKDAEYLSHVVGSYRKMIDRYYENPYMFNIPSPDLKDMYKNGIRDFSSSFALKKARLETVGLSGAKEPKFFSRAVKEPRVREAAEEALTIPSTPHTVSLTVHVATLETLQTVLDYKPSWIYLDTRVPVSYWDNAKMSAAVSMAKERGVPIALSIPSVINDNEEVNLEHFLDDASYEKPDGYLTGNPGVIKMLKAKNIENVFADYTLNVTNKLSVSFLKSLGVKRYCFSPEFPTAVTSTMIDSEMLVQGPIPQMQFESCYIFNIKGKNSDYCPGYCTENKFGFKDEAGEVHEIVPDSRCRNYLMSASHLCLLNNLNEAMNKDVKYLRVDARLYGAEFTSLLLRLYTDAVKAISGKGCYRPDKDDFRELMQRSPYPLGTGVYHRMLNMKKAV